MAEFSVVPMLAVHPDRINLYSQVVWHPRKPLHFKRFDIRQVSNKHAGKVSTTARRKVSKAIEYLLFMARSKTLPDTYHGKCFKFKLSFITLTLPSSQIHTDNEIKASCLNQFLIEARTRWAVKNYIWRSEKQRNGSLHFHILTDKFVPWSELRDVWNRISNKLGYVDRYRDQMRAFHTGGINIRTDLLAKWAYKAQIRAYNTGKANDWASPNSTDVHSLHKIKNIKDYICKYIAKNEQTEGLTGRLWGCNEKLSHITGGQCIADNSIKSEIDYLIQSLQPKTYSGAYFTTIFIDFKSIRKSGYTELWNLFSSYLVSHFNFNLQTEFII